MASNIAVPALSAIEASLSVLITIGIGVVAAQYGLLSSKASKDISRVCVNLFLPCLLIANLGEELNIDTGLRYVPIVIWALIYNLLGLYIARVGVILFKLPNWTVPATAFNNTTSLPLLLIQSLKTTGLLSSLVGKDGGDDAYTRARSYFLMCAVVSHTLTFGKGPDTLNGFDEDTPPYQAVKDFRDGAVNLVSSSSSSSIDEESQRSDGREEDGDEEQQTGGGADQDSDNDEDEADAQTPLMPPRVVHLRKKAHHKATKFFRSIWSVLPNPVKQVLQFFGPFFNNPTIGALVGIIIGLTPPLHRIFFADPDDGGFLNGWLTTALNNTGELFVTLQVVIVGVKLSFSLQKMKKGQEAGTVPWRAIIFVTSMRFIILPAMSIPIIWLLASRTNILSTDPILWFTMMLMPTGPSAMKLLAMTDMTDVDEKTKMSIARFLTIQYAVTPLISLSVVGALKAAEAIQK